MNLDQIRWLLVDLDNTILDYSSSARSALANTYKAFGIPVTDKNIGLYITINNKCWNEFETGKIDIKTLKAKRFELFVESIDSHESPQAINKYYLSALSEEASVMPGALTFLDWARSRFKLAVVTNGFPEVQRPRIKRAGLQSYFEHLIISEEIGSSKPHANFFDHLFERIYPAEKSQIMIIGDNLYSDIKGGHDFGIQTCWYNPLMIKNELGVKPHLEIASFGELVAQWPEQG